MKTRLERLETLCDKLMSFVGAGNSETLTRQQAMAFLHVGSTKLWELSKDGDIATTSVGGKILYVTTSCQQYLMKRGYSKEAVQEQMQALLTMKQMKKR